MGDILEIFRNENNCSPHLVHTMEELKLTGNHLKGSRPILTFSTNFDKDPHWKLLKELIMQVLDCLCDLELLLQILLLFNHMLLLKSFMRYHD